jgi:hypothetical protein
VIHVVRMALSTEKCNVTRVTLAFSKKKAFDHANAT